MEKTYRKSLVFSAACVGMLLFGVSFITLGAVTLPLRAKFGLSELETAALFAVLPVGIITGSMLFGPVADRYGYKGLMIAACLALSVGFMGIAYAPSLGVLKACVYFFGFGGGAMNGSTNALVSLISGQDRVARLSLLGVFYGIGALGMPVLLGAVEGRMPYEHIVGSVSALTLLAALFFLTIRFPAAQRAVPFSISMARKVVRNRMAMLVALFLFLQMGMEAAVNNWTTTFLVGHQGVARENALYGLSILVSGMTVMRILIGSLFKGMPGSRLLLLSLALIFIGVLVLSFPVGFVVLAVGLALLGAGMAAGVPLMLSVVGALFSEMAGTAFSVVIVIGLVGNLALNYLVGYITEQYGIGYFAYALFAQWGLMALLAYIISQQINKRLIP